MATTARIVDSHGNPGRLKLRRIREHEAAGAGKWQDGTFVFTRHAERSQTLRQSPAFGPFVPCRVDIHDSGQSGFLRYPLAYGVTSQPKYPGLALQGAGLA